MNMIAKTYEDLLSFPPFDLALIDPPWKFDNWSQTLGDHDPSLDRGANKHYNTMPIDEIISLKPNIKTNALLFMWVIRSHIPEALQLANAWGFSFVTQAFTWVKLNTNNMGVKFGMGYYTRSACEYVYLFKRGKGIGAPPTSQRPGELIMQPVQRHSEKPQVFFDKLHIMYPQNDIMRLEMYCRKPREGWHTFGNELT